MGEVLKKHEWIFFFFNYQGHSFSCVKIALRYVNRVEEKLRLIPNALSAGFLVNWFNVYLTSSSESLVDLNDFTELEIRILNSNWVG